MTVRIIEFKTDNVVDAVRPLEHAVHYLACAMEKKGGKLGSHAVYLLLYPARIVDRVIQLAITPLICVIGNIYEAFAIPYNNPNEKYLKHVLTLPFRLPFYLLGNLIQRCGQLALAALPFATIYGIVFGAEVGKFYFAKEKARMEVLKERDDFGSPKIQPHLRSLPIKEDFVMAKDQAIKIERQPPTHKELSIFIFFSGDFSSRYLID